jgi:hypothetical protein
MEMDLEELEELEAHPPRPKPAPRAAHDTAAPEPALQPDRSGTEIEVPIDIEVAPGTTRITLNVKLVLNLRRR